MGGLLECMMKMQIIFYLKNNIVKTVYSPNEYYSSFGIFLHIKNALCITYYTKVRIMLEKHKQFYKSDTLLIYQMTRNI